MSPEPKVSLTISVKQLDFIVNVLGQVPTLTTVQAGMLDLIPTLAGQAQNSLERDKAEEAAAAAGIEEALR